jgi:hypothetical protein
LRPNYTGVLTDAPLVGLLETALKIHSQAQHYAIVNGASKIEIDLVKKISKAYEPYATRLDFIYVACLLSFLWKNCQIKRSAPLPPALFHWEVMAQCQSAETGAAYSRSPNGIILS